jgi:hypothetical protein
MIYMEYNELIVRFSVAADALGSQHSLAEIIVGRKRSAGMVTQPSSGRSCQIMPKTGQSANHPFAVIRSDWVEHKSGWSATAPIVDIPALAANARKPSLRTACPLSLRSKN